MQACTGRPVLLENLLRYEDGNVTTRTIVRALLDWDPTPARHRDPVHPARVILQDFTGVPAVVDLAAMREAMVEASAVTRPHQPAVPAELVIDHSVVADVVRHRGRAAAQHRDRVRAQPGALPVPALGPGGVRRASRSCRRGHGHRAPGQHRVPRARGVPQELPTAVKQAYPDTLVGTDSHTTMVNGLGVLGWGVGGIEAEAAMLGQPVSMLIPRWSASSSPGELPDGRDRDRPGADDHRDAARARRGRQVRRVLRPGVHACRWPTGRRSATCRPSTARRRDLPDRRGDAALPALHRPQRGQVALVEAYAKAQGLWHDPATPRPSTPTSLELDLADIVPSARGSEAPAGPHPPLRREARLSSSTCRRSRPSAPTRSKGIAEARFVGEGGDGSIGNPASASAPGMGKGQPRWRGVRAA
jgi:aconitate hydratase